MSRKILYLLIVLPVMAVLAACSSLQLSGSNTTGSQSQANPAQNFANQPVEGKLAIGILKLEGTDKAITAEQAQNLLPLWKAFKSLSSSNNASTEEITALYKQIQDALTAEQVQAIKDLNLVPADLQALMQQYNIQGPMGNAPSANGTPAARTSGGPGGPPPDGGAGGPPPDGGIGGPGGTGIGQANAQGTPQAGQTNRGMRGGMNLMFVDVVIKLLEQRAG